MMAKKAKDMLEPERIIISSQGGSEKRFLRGIEFLFKSLEMFGGKLARAKKIACFNEQIDSETENLLGNLDVRIKYVEDIDKRCPHANKIQILSLAEKEDYDYLVALDSDIVITNDFSDFISNKGIGLKPVDKDPLSFQNWKKFFGYFGLEVPPQRYETTFSMTETIAYFNSGVLIIPKKYVLPLYKTWKEFVYKVLESYEKLPEIAKHSFHTDQFSLALALTHQKLPLRILPLEMNFPINRDVHPDYHPENLSPFIIHYHRRISDTGQIMHSSYDNINRVIDKINDGLKNFHQKN